MNQMIPRLVVLSLLAGVTALIACGGDLTEPGMDNPAVVVNQDAALQAVFVARVIGQGELDNVFSLTVVALLKSDGSAIGRLVVPDFLHATVVGLVPPHDEIDHFCVNTAPNIEGFPGFRLFMYVRDVGDGFTTFDEVSFRGELAGTCAAFPSPNSPFEALVRGDFKTSS